MSELTVFERERRARNRSCLAMPSNLSPEGRAAWKTVRSFLTARHSTYCGGCKAFYTPPEWKDREPYVILTENLILVVVHDGGELANVFNLDYGCTRLYDDMRSILSGAGFWAEAVTTWYSYIYKTHSPKVSYGIRDGSSKLPAVRQAHQRHDNNVQVQHADNLHDVQGEGKESPGLRVSGQS